MAEPTVAAAGRRHPSLVLWPLALPFLILAGVAGSDVVKPAAPTTVSGPGTRGSLVWGNGIFANRAELKAWLDMHGGNYEGWAKQHPAAVRLVTARPRAHAGGRVPAKGQGARPATHMQRAPARTISAVRRARAPSTGSRPTDVNLLLWLLIGIGAVLAAGVVAPQRLLGRLGLANLWQDSNLRLLAATGSAAVLIGVIIATQLG